VLATGPYEQQRPPARCTFDIHASPARLSVQALLQSADPAMLQLAADPPTSALMHC
jgi:hypothetical protein